MAASQPIGRGRRELLAALTGVVMIALHAEGNWTAAEGIIVPHIVLSLIGLLALLLVPRLARLAESQHVTAWARSTGTQDVALDTRSALEAPWADREGRRSQRAVLRSGATAESAYLAVRCPRSALPSPGRCGHGHSIGGRGRVASASAMIRRAAGWRRASATSTRPSCR